MQDYKGKNWSQVVQGLYNSTYLTGHFFSPQSDLKANSGIWNVFWFVPKHSVALYELICALDPSQFVRPVSENQNGYILFLLAWRYMTFSEMICTIEGKQACCISHS